MSAIADNPKLCLLDPQAFAQQFPQDVSAEELEVIKKAQASIVDWNHDVEMVCREHGEQCSKNRSYLLPSGVTRSELPAPAGTLLDRYAVADTLALHLQRQLRHASRTILILACGGLICFELAHWFAHLHAEWAVTAVKVMTLAFVTAWGVAIYFDRKAHHHRIQERYQDYRALAEGLRVQFYWIWAGVKEKATEGYPKRQREDLLWLRFALGQWIPNTEASATDPKAVLSSWITHQLDYFIGQDRQSGQVAKNRYYNERCKKFGRLSLFVSIGLGGVAVVSMLFAKWALHEEVISHMNGLLILLAGIGIVVAATCYAWRERFAYAEHVKNYSAMTRIYQEAKRRMENGTDLPEAILVDLGHEALSESTEWLMLHRERHATEARL